jgi:hypothetical protein
MNTNPWHWTWRSYDEKNTERQIFEYAGISGILKYLTFEGHEGRIYL